MTALNANLLFAVERSPTRVRKSSASQAEKLAALVSDVNLCFARLGLEAEDVRAYIRELTSGQQTQKKDSKMELVVESVIKEHRVPDDPAAFEAFIRQLDELLDLDLPLSVFDSTPKKIWQGILVVWATFFFVFVCFVVIGGIVEGHSALMKTSNPILSVLVLVFLISLLAVVEGLHVTVTALRLKDLNLIREAFPKVFNLHRQFRTEEGTNRFLSGRQLIVIIVVFFTAQLTSFPQMTGIPFTHITLPLWFRKIFLEFGVLGAFFVLWIGQLIPQFVANKNPQGFMESRPVVWVFKLAYLIESLELTRPAHFIATILSRGTASGEDIPVSPAERYRLEVEKLQGYGIVGLKKIWHISNTNSILYYNSSVVFTAPGFDQLSDSGLLIRGSSPKPYFAFELLRSQKNQASEAEDMNIYDIDTFVEPTTEEAWRRFVQRVRPRYGSFEPNDVALSRTRVEFPGTVQSDMIQVLRPAKYVLFRVKFLQNPAHLATPKIKVYRNDDSIGKSTLMQEQALPLLTDKEGDRYAEYLDLYPELNTTYMLSWGVEY